MSFSSGVKDELAAVPILSPCCLLAQAYGLALFSRFFSYRSIVFSSEHELTARLFCENMKSLVSISPQYERKSQKTHTVRIKTAAERASVMDLFGHSQTEPTLRLNRANLSDDCCFEAFLRGVFLACGTVTDPVKNYHIEFVVPHLKLSLDLVKLLNEMKFYPKRIARKGSYVVYLKDRESIEDILTVMGATNSSLALMGIKMHKNMRNKVNRKVNFETANLSKTVDASSRHIQAIELIESKTGLDALPEPLREAAEKRRDYPEKSLAELGRLFRKPISRSGVNHRLNKLVEIANKAEDQ